MMQKLEKLIDVATEAFAEARDYYAAARGATLPLRDAAPAPVKEAKTRVKKEKVPAAPGAPEVAASPFGIDTAAGGDNAAKVALSAEEALEARRRGQEVMGLFIRRYLKAAPTGLDRAKKVINETLGGPRAPKAAWQLEDILPEDWLKLTPIFEAELDKAGA